MGEGCRSCRFERERSLFLRAQNNAVLGGTLPLRLARKLQSFYANCRLTWTGDLSDQMRNDLVSELSKLNETDMTRLQSTRSLVQSGHIVSILLLIGFIAAVEWFFGWDSLLAPWSTLTPVVITGIGFILMMTYAARGLRLYRFFRSELDFLSCLTLLLKHNLWVVLMPARTGEVAFPVLMRQRFGIAPGRSIPVLLWFRLLDMHVLALIIGVAWGWGYSPTITILFATCWIGALAVCILSRRAVTDWLHRRSGKLARKLGNLMESAPQSATKLFESWAWTVVSWTMKMLLFAWIISAFTTVNFLPSMAGALGGEISTVLPIHGIGGVGSYQSGVAFALLPFGVSIGEAIQGGVNLHLVVLGGAVISGLIAYATPAGIQRVEAF